jgi:hypothetical protein
MSIHICMGLIELDLKGDEDERRGIRRIYSADDLQWI